MRSVASPFPIPPAISALDLSDARVRARTRPSSPSPLLPTRSWLMRARRLGVGGRDVVASRDALWRLKVARR